MKSLALVLAGIAVGAIALSVVHSTRASSERRDRSGVVSSDRSNTERSNAGSDPDLSEEVRRLRAELRNRDQLLSSLLVASHASAAALPPESAPRETADANAEDHAAALLDERMLHGPNDPARQSEMERAARKVASSPSLAAAKIDAVSCESTVCKVTLTADDDRRLNESVADISAHLPKFFGAAVVHHLSTGEIAMYLARSNRDLAVAPTASPHAE